MKYITINGELGENATPREIQLVHDMPGYDFARGNNVVLQFHPFSGGAVNGKLYLISIKYYIHGQYETYLVEDFRSAIELARRYNLTLVAATAGYR